VILVERSEWGVKPTMEVKISDESIDRRSNGFEQWETFDRGVSLAKIFPRGPE